MVGKMVLVEVVIVKNYYLFTFPLLVSVFYVMRFCVLWDRLCLDHYCLLVHNIFFNVLPLCTAAFSTKTIRDSSIYLRLFIFAFYFETYHLIFHLPNNVQRRRENEGSEAR